MCVFAAAAGGKAVPFGEMCSHVVCSADILEAPEGLPSSCAAVKMEVRGKAVPVSSVRL